MKCPLPVFFFLIALSGPVQAQDPVAILRSAVDACRDIEHGYYALQHDMKYMSGPDTSHVGYEVYFRRLPDDTLFPSALYAMRYWQDTLASRMLYTGREFITTHEKEMTGKVMSVDRWASEIDNIKHNYTDALFAPLTDADRPLGSRQNMLEDTSYTFTYMGREPVGSWDSHRVRIRQTPVPDSTEMIKVHLYESDFWMRTDDFLPVRTTRMVELTMGKDTMVQFESATLTDLSMAAPEPRLFEPAVIGPHIQLEDYTPYVSPDPLPVDTIAPDFVVQTLAGDTLRLSDLRGEVVLLDFFYKSCYPCLLALPGLQRLHETYGDRGLTVIGLDPYDDEGDDMPAFLGKRGVTYAVALTDREFPKPYRVSGYPTLYLIDQQGVISEVHVGYGEAMEGELAQKIEDLLARD